MYFNEMIFKIIPQKKKKVIKICNETIFKVIYVVKYKKIQYQSEIKSILSRKSKSVNFSTVIARSIIFTLLLFKFAILHF